MHDRLDNLRRQGEEAQARRIHTGADLTRGAHRRPNSGTLGARKRRGEGKPQKAAVGNSLQHTLNVV